MDPFFGGNFLHLLNGGRILLYMYVYFKIQRVKYFKQETTTYLNHFDIKILQRHLNLKETGVDIHPGVDIYS